MPFCSGSCAPERRVQTNKGSRRPLYKNMADFAHRKLACRRYVQFLFKSYLKWESLQDVCDVSILVRFHKATMVENKAYYPNAFIDTLRIEILTYLEVEYGCSGSGWIPEVECSLVPGERALSLEIWFTPLPRRFSV